MNEPGRILASRNQRRKSGSQNKAQNSDQAKDEEGKARNKKQGQNAGGKKRVKEKGLKLVPEKVLADLPKPGALHLEALSQLLSHISNDHGLSKADIALRWEVFSGIDDLFKQTIEGTGSCSLRLYGSSLSCLGLKSSDVNIDVHEENEEKIPRIFISFLNALKSCQHYGEIKEEFESKWPVINFKDINSGLTCKVSCGNNFAFFTNSLLKFYGDLDSRVKPLCHSFRFWAKICEVDRQAAGTLPPHSFFLMVIHYLQQIEPPVLPVVHEELGDDLIECCQEENFGLLADVKKIWKTKNTLCLGQLWLGLLSFYSDYEKNEIYVVNIRQKKKLRRSEKFWGKQKLAVEDPFSTKRNIARTLVKNNAYRYIVEHLRVALVYFSYHPDSAGLQGKENGSEDTDQIVVARLTRDEDAPRKDEIHAQASVEDDLEGASSDENGQDDIDGEDEDETEELVDGIFAVDTINDTAISDNGDSEEERPSLLNDSGFPSESTEDSMTRISGSDGVDWTNVKYLFNDSVLRKGNALDTKCTFCGEEGHIVDNCTEEQVSRNIKPLPKVPDWWFSDVLTAVCYCCKEDFGIRQDDITKRHFYLRALEKYITKFLPDARLHLFGSSCNGFGFTGSDMDMCMTLSGKTKADVDCVGMVTRLAGILRKNPECANVIAITSAKVPIVKFFLRHGKVEADISLYNEVALCNTRLLATYVRIDERVRILGCTLKIFVKLCDIGDASKGSLSSYAYILMLLHFLQQRRPPVLPVLQEMYDSAEQPKHIIEGHNCWFYNELDKLNTKWTPRNKENCGELWLGFLRYYTEEFDYRRNVVSIRYLQPLTKFEKLWNGRQICIEDPFVLSHNLGAALSLGMVKFIRSTFEKARERFGTARKDLPVNIQDRQRFFFDPIFLTSGNTPPTGRNCNVCGKIGHWAKECPFNKKSGRDKSEKSQENKAQKQVKDEKNFQKNTESNPQHKNERNRKMNTGRDDVNKTRETEQKKEQEKMKVEDPTRIIKDHVVTTGSTNAKEADGNLDRLQRSKRSQPQPAIPPAFPQQEQSTRERGPTQMNSPLVGLDYQPLSPPISPGNQVPMTSSLQLPSPMPNISPAPISPMGRQHPSNPVVNDIPPVLTPGSPHMGTTPGISPMQSGVLPTSPVSPFIRSYPHGSPQMVTIPSTSPVRSGAIPTSPFSPLARLQHSPPNHPPMFNKGSPPMRNVTGTSPQNGPPPRCFGNPGNPFAFNFLAGGQNIYHSLPLYQLYASAQRLQSSQARGHPLPTSGQVVSQETSTNRGPRIISCAELERGNDPVQSVDKDQIDGVKAAKISDTSSSGIKKGQDMSVLESLKALEIDDQLTYSQQVRETQSAMIKGQDRKGSADGNVDGSGEGVTDCNDKLNQQFQPPPKVQNIASMSLNLSEQISTENETEAFRLKAEYSEEDSRKTSRKRRRSRQKKGVQGIKDIDNATQNVPEFKNFSPVVSLQQQQQQQQQQTQNQLKQQQKIEGGGNVGPQQQTHQQQIQGTQATLKKKGTKQANLVQQPNSLQHAGKQMQQLPQSEEIQPNKNSKQQQSKKGSPSNQPKSKEDSQRQKAAESRQRKPREIKNIQYNKNKLQTKVVNSFAKPSHPGQGIQQGWVESQKQQVEGDNNAKQQEGSKNRRQTKEAGYRTPTGEAIDRLVIKVQGDQREVNTLQNSPFENVNEGARRRRRRRKPKSNTPNDVES